MKRSRLPGASRGLGRDKPHIEWVAGRGYACFNIVRSNHPFIGAEVIEVAGFGSTPGWAFTHWFNSKWTIPQVTVPQI